MWDLLQLGGHAALRSVGPSGPVEQHRKQLLQNYTKRILKPNIHICYHVPEALGRVGANMTCSATERSNQTCKAIMGNAKGRHPEAPLLTRILFDIIECADDASRLQEFEPVSYTHLTLPTILLV
eukprot:7668411-Pyramimonas_sp.AAC.1